MRNRSASRLLAVLPPLLVAACTVGPDYERPSAPTSPAYKEVQGWKPATPQLAASGTSWWQVFDDPVLDGLERQVSISNQTLKEDEAAYRQAVALVDEAHAGYFPTLSLGGSADRGNSRGGSSGVSSGAASTTTTATGTGTTTTTTSPVTTTSSSTGSRTASSLNSYGLTASASWAPDIWGKISRTVEGDVASAQASAADLAAARLSAQGTLATDYFNLRIQDAQKRLLDDTVAAYQRSLTITQNQYKAGTAAKSDVITAQTQLQAAQSQEISVGVARAQDEHAIAVLIGKPPSELTIEPAPQSESVPVAPSGLPSGLLERRPDIAAAERAMQAANAQVGVAIAAYYPDLTLSGSYGVDGNSIGHLFNASNTLWSIGASAAETIFDGGLRDAELRAAKATYDQNIATYRETVLTAFQAVEDNLAALRILEQQFAVQQATVDSANEAVRLALNEYKAGTVSYTTVVTAQATALSAAQSLVTIKQSRLDASVALIQALGGGWSQDQLPTRDTLETAEVERPKE